MATTKKTAVKKAARPRKAAATKPEETGTAALARTSRPLTLVTGGTGFLGSHLVRLLAEDAAGPLRVLATSEPAWLGELGVEVVRGSITSPDDVARAVEGASSVYHLAGRVSREPDDAHTMYKLHVEGTRVLCRAARAAGVGSIVMASKSGTIAVTEDGGVIPDEEWPTPLDIISRWPYYASKLYQERVALENFSGEGRRLVMVNPSLLLGPGDERLSSTKVVLDFLARKIPTVPRGGLSFVDARDVALGLRAAMERGEHGSRYLLGAANWTFGKFFGRLERITKVPAPFVSPPSKLTLAGARGISALFKQWKLSPPVEPAEIEMAEYFWYLDSTKAERELSFAPRDPQETLLDTITYVRENFLGGAAFGKAV
jgi:dihydroflavonol-4-reductase